jgi:hypothetical protein
MSYSDLYTKQNIRIPTPVGILVVLIVSIICFRIFTPGAAVQTKASNKSLKRVEITNIYPTQVTVYWQTANLEKGWLLYGESSGGTNQIAFDDRDIETEKKQYRNHIVTLKGLKEKQTYFFRIVSNNSAIFVKQDGSPYSFSTPSQDIRNSTLRIAYGTAVYKNEIPLENAIVLLYVHEQPILSTITKTKGDWLITLNNILYSTSGLPIRTPSEKEVLMFEIISEDGQVSQIKTNLLTINPIPKTIIIGTSYDFTKEESDVLAASTKQILVQQTGSFPIEITYPKEDAIIDARQPLIKGLGVPGKEVILFIQSDKLISMKTTADKNGVWLVRDIGNFTPGTYTIKMETQDIQNNKITLQRKFIMAKSGERAVLGEATASPTLSLLSPTVFPTPTIIFSILTPTPTQPVTGIASFSVLYIGAACFIAGLGLLLAF